MISCDLSEKRQNPKAIPSRHANSSQNSSSKQSPSTTPWMARTKARKVKAVEQSGVKAITKNVQRRKRNEESLTYECFFEANSNPTHNAPRLNDFRAAMHEWRLVRVARRSRNKTEPISRCWCDVCGSDREIALFTAGNPRRSACADNAESKALLICFRSLSVPAGFRVRSGISGGFLSCFAAPKTDSSRRRSNSNQTKLIKSTENWIKLIWWRETGEKLSDLRLWQSSL